MAPKLHGNKAEFIQWMKAILAEGNSKSTRFVELYHFLFFAFTQSDTKYTGLVDLNDFDVLVEIISSLPRKWGLAPLESEVFKCDADKVAFRKNMFQAMDTNNSAADFRGWLSEFRRIFGLHAYAYIGKSKDDLGWNDVSWHDSNMHTPNLKRLAFSNGAILNQSYVNQQCSPTRSAFLTGHYPFHLGTQHGVFWWQEPTGVPIEFPFFPEELQLLDYKTYLVGKWHLGYCKKAYLPNYRGFDFFNGFYMGSQDYYTHSLKGPKLKINATGLDFWDQEEPEFRYNGSYSTELFSAQVGHYLVTHNKSKPFFMYLAFQAPHSPLEVPAQYLKPCKQKRKDRRIYCGMVNALDVAVGRVVSTLKNLGLKENTIIIFSTDNGGQTKFGGNNYPLRGNKNTLWEGGTRAISFVHSPKFIKRPGIRDNLFHIVDWYATIVAMTGWRVSSYGDGINQWRMIRGLEQKRKRKSLVYNIDDEGSAIREGKYKIIIGKAGTPSGWIPPAGPARNWPSDKLDKNILLFDLEKDPTERHDIASMSTLKLISKLIDKVVKLTLQKVPSIHRPPDPRGDPKYFNGTFGSGFC